MSLFCKIDFQGFPTSPESPDLDVCAESYAQLKWRLLQGLNAGQMKRLWLHDIMWMTSCTTWSVLDGCLQLIGSLEYSL